MKQTVQVKLNLEMAAEPSITEIAIDVHPDQATLVPERREEVTTEGGLDVAGNRERVARCIDRLLEAGIEVSLFIDADRAQIDAAEQLGAHAVELHTGRYADAIESGPIEEAELTQLIDAGHWARGKDDCCYTWAHGLDLPQRRPSCPHSWRSANSTSVTSIRGPRVSDGRLWNGPSAKMKELVSVRRRPLNRNENFTSGESRSMGIIRTSPTPPDRGRRRCPKTVLQCQGKQQQAGRGHEVLRDAVEP